MQSTEPLRLAVLHPSHDSGSEWLHSNQAQALKGLEDSLRQLDQSKFDGQNLATYFLDQINFYGVDHNSGRSLCYGPDGASNRRSLGTPATIRRT
jgi:hypothetical protein